MRYIDRIPTLKMDEPNNGLIVGTAMHTGLEQGVQEAIQEYFMQYPVITDEHINEAIKLEIQIPKAAKLLPNGEFEVLIECEDFKGYIDFLAPVTAFHDAPVPDLYDIWDFKYTNNKDRYNDSVQIHLYKYFFEKLTGKKIRKLFYLCIPKTNIRQKKTETLTEFRNRIRKELENAEPELIEVEYDPNKVIAWLLDTKHTLEAVEFPQKQSRLCDYCELKDYCLKGVDYMLLPKNERRNIEVIQKKVVWLYGSPFSGKTTFANKFPDPLMLNTDGNIRFVDAPYIAIKDRIETSGRAVNKTFAWDIFKDVVSELEKKENGFETIVIDLLEDLYEYCRLYMYDQMGITHESDESFKAWDKVRLEFLSTLKRLMALDYKNIVLISHEDSTKDVTKKSGDKLTSIKPNLADKVATKVAGMVDIVARVVADGDNRTLSFKTNEVIFGGGRLHTNKVEIPLDYNEFLKVYEDANKKVEVNSTIEENVESNSNSEPTVDAEPASVPTEAEPETPQTRTRKRRA